MCTWITLNYECNNCTWHSNEVKLDYHSKCHLNRWTCKFISLNCFIQLITMISVKTDQFSLTTTKIDSIFTMNEYTINDKQYLWVGQNIQFDFVHEVCRQKTDGGHFSKLIIYCEKHANHLNQNRTVRWHWDYPMWIWNVYKIHMWFWIASTSNACYECLWLVWMRGLGKCQTSAENGIEYLTLICACMHNNIHERRLSFVYFDPFPSLANS